jgi:uncharacterized membrane protein (UPF0127 family)
MARLAPVLLALAALAALAAPAAGAPADPPDLGGRAVMPGGEVIHLEIADDPLERYAGLRGRARLPDDRGMLFLFHADEQHTFVMEDCLISLDLLWLDRRGRVLHVEPELPPCPEEAEECPTWTSPGPARYVLELRGGRASELGLETGSLILLDVDSGRGR